MRHNVGGIAISKTGFGTAAGAPTALAAVARMNHQVLSSSIRPVAGPLRGDRRQSGHGRAIVSCAVPQRLGALHGAGRERLDAA